MNALGRHLRAMNIHCIKDEGSYGYSLRVKEILCLFRNVRSILQEIRELGLLGACWGQREFLYFQLYSSPILA